MIGNFFLLIDRVDNKDTIVGEGVVSECVAAGHYRCEFLGPGPEYARILSVGDMRRFLLFGSSSEMKRFKDKLFKEKAGENVPNSGG